MALGIVATEAFRPPCEGQEPLLGWAKGKLHGRLKFIKGCNRLCDGLIADHQPVANDSPGVAQRREVPIQIDPEEYTHVKLAGTFAGQL